MPPDGIITRHDRADRRNHAPPPPAITCLAKVETGCKALHHNPSITTDTTMNSEIPKLVVEQFYAAHPILGNVISALVVAVPCISILIAHLRKFRVRKSTPEEVEEYLKNPAYVGGLLERHLLDTRAYWVFKKLTGIRCKKPMREALLELHDGDKIPSSWSWGFLSGASRHLEFEGGSLKYRVNFLERLFQVLHYGIATTLWCLGLILAVAIILVDKPSESWGLLVLKAVLIFAGFCFFAQTQPLEHARALKHKLAMPYYSESSPWNPSRPLRWILKKVSDALRCKSPEAATRRRGKR